MQRLLVISNGIGEDSIDCAEIVRRRCHWFHRPRPIRRWVRARPIAPPVRSSGRGRTLPSEGSRVGRGTIHKDIARGLFGTIGPGLKFLREAKTAYDRLPRDRRLHRGWRLLARRHRNVVYLDVYHTGFGRQYSLIEKLIIKRTAATVFTAVRGWPASLRRWASMRGPRAT